MYVGCRYLFALQIKRDLSTGNLICQEHTAVLLASFVLQGVYQHSNIVKLLESKL